MMICCGPRRLSRRSLMAGGLASMAPKSPFFAASVGTTWIDAHTHVFNAIDIPITEFIAQTRRSWVTEVGEPVIAIVVFLMRLQCPTAKTEIAMLANGQPRFGAMAALHRAPSTLRVLRHINDPSNPDYMLPPPDPGFRRPPMPRGAKGLILEALGTHIEGLAITQVTVPDEALRALARRIDPNEASPGRMHAERTKALGPLLEWAGGFARSRYDIVRSLAQQYRGTNLLAVAAWIDYSRPLGIEAGAADEPTALADQIAVGAALTKAFAKPGAQPRLLLANFIGYDPMRAALRRPDEEDPISQLERAVHAGEVVGVKLYPPMGFRPIRNALLSNDFPRLLRAKYKKRSGTALDRELRRLFTFCDQNDVPIMTHCGDTNYTKHRYGERASPRYWLSLLDDGFPNLRLNLAHFGGVWSFGNAKARDAEAADVWPQIIVRALSNTESLYPNLYTDIAYASDLLVSGDAGSDAKEKKDANDFLQSTLGISTIGRRLMYGSDWQMVGQERLADQYSSLVDADISKYLPPEMHEDFRWRNAARFLGLGKDGATRRRLHRLLGADADILADFDPR